MSKHQPSPPMVDIRAAVAINGAGYYALKHYTHVVGEAGCEQPGRQASYWVNLQRLGLVELKDGYIMSPQADGIDPYENLINDVYIRNLEKEIVACGRFMDVRKGAATITPFGFQFCEACCVGK